MQIIFNVNILLYALLTKRLYICHWLIWSASTPKPIRTQDSPHLDHSRSQLLYLADFLKLVKKVQKAGFFRSICSKITIAKEKERRKRKSEEDERRRRKRSNSCTLSFNIGLLWRQFLVVYLAVTFSKIRLVHEYDIQYVVYIQLCIDRVSLRIQLCFKGLK